MSLYNDASLVMIPSAYKDGKLYSIKPTDGSGDFTFSRGSNLAATRVDENGLIEKGRENVLLQSNQFDTTWTKTNVSVTSGQSGYDGSNDAWLIKYNTTASRHNIYRTVTPFLSEISTVSIYAKAKELQYIQLAFVNTTNQYANFDLSDGSIGNVGSDFFGAKAESVGNGWYRLSVVDKRTSNTLYISIISSKTAGWLESFSGANDTDGLYIQDAQVELGLVATDYIETTTTTAQAGILEDMPRLDYSESCPSLLLEPQRTNLVPNSEYFGDTQWLVVGVSLDANNTTSPDGLQNAYKITDDTSTGYHKITESSVFTADGTMRTWSVFVKKENARYCVLSHAAVFSSSVNSLIFDMESGVYTSQGTTAYFDIVHDPIDMGNGWWRIGFSSDLNSSSYVNFSIGISQGPTWSGNVSYTGDGSLDFYIYGAQVESGSYPTSYIPCYGAATTRSADVCNKTGISSLIGQEQGTIFIECNVPNFNPNPNATIFSTTLSTSNSIGLIYKSNNTFLYTIFHNSLREDIPSSSTFNIGDKVKIACVYSLSGAKLFINGTSQGVNTDPISFTATLSEIKLLDAVSVYFAYPTANIADQFAVFKTALTDSECIALTTL